MQDISSRRGVYSGYFSVMAALLFLLVWSKMSSEADLANALFLSDGVIAVLTWAMLLMVLMTAVVGVLLGSSSKAIVPGIVAIIVVTVFGEVSRHGQGELIAGIFLAMLTGTCIGGILRRSERSLRARHSSVSSSMTARSRS